MSSHVSFEWQWGIIFMGHTMGCNCTVGVGCDLALGALTLKLKKPPQFYWAIQAEKSALPISSHTKTLKKQVLTLRITQCKHDIM